MEYCAIHIHCVAPSLSFSGEFFLKIFSSFNAVFGYFWLLLYAVCICFSSGLDYFHARLGEGKL